MNTNNQPNYQVYRGLQKPLVFKSFKGRYIYWGLGSILLALLTAMIVAPLVSLFAGIFSMALVLGFGLGTTAYFQHHGNKNTFNGTAIMPNNPTIHESRI